MTVFTLQSNHIFFCLFLDVPCAFAFWSCPSANRCLYGRLYGPPTLTHLGGIIPLHARPEVPLCHGLPDAWHAATTSCTHGGGSSWVSDPWVYTSSMSNGIRGHNPEDLCDFQFPGVSLWHTDPPSFAPMVRHHGVTSHATGRGI